MREKFGVAPASIPDYLGLVGDSRRRHPRHPPLGRQGHRPGAGLLRPHRGRFRLDATDWAINVRGAKSLAASLSENMEAALLYRQLATLRLDVPIAEDVATNWSGKAPTSRTLPSPVRRVRVWAAEGWGGVVEWGLGPYMARPALQRHHVYL